MKAKESNLLAAMLLFHNFYEKYLEKKLCIFRKSITNPSFHDSKFSAKRLLRHFSCIRLFVSTDSLKIRIVEKAVAPDGKPLILNFIKAFWLFRN
jgi:hypothetical protein